MSKTVAGVLCGAALILAGCGGRTTGVPALPANVPEPALTIGSTYQIKVACFGGATELALDRGLRLVAVKDEAMLQKLFQAGELVKLEPGTAVTVEEVPKVGKAKVKVAGRTGVWIHEVWVRR